MNTLLRSIYELLDLEQIDENRYRGLNRDVGGKSVFGGQVMGQALAAANRTVIGRQAHSLHAYFLLPGDMELPIDYVVERVRDGRSFATRSIIALQRNVPIFQMSASYQIDEAGLEHRIVIPAVPGPEELPSLVELINAEAARDPEKYRQRKDVNLPIEFRLVQEACPDPSQSGPPPQKFWFRSGEALTGDNAMHQCVLAYASDFGLLNAATVPHGLSFGQENVHIASIDHAMWFHRPFRADDWLLYVMQSPSASGARGFVQGSIFAQDGLLVASVAQEGLMRLVK